MHIFLFPKAHPSRFISRPVTFHLKRCGSVLRDTLPCRLHFVSFVMLCELSCGTLPCRSRPHFTLRKCITADRGRIFVGAHQMCQPNMYCQRARAQLLLHYTVSGFGCASNKHKARERPFFLS